MISINVDDKELIVEKNLRLIDVLIKNDIKIPYFCYQEALGADGNCRMCMVEIEGQKRPQIACDTFVKEGMSVHTKSEKIRKVQQNILELELINHPIDCPVCDQAGECKLQDFYMDYGLYDSHFDSSKKVHHKKHIDLGSNVILDQERCVLCARCTRFTSNITKTNELGIVGRGDKAHVSTIPGRELDNPYAMNVVDLCPVGALTSKDFRFHQRSWFLKSSPSICHGCATGCNITIDHNKEKYGDDTIYRFRPRVNHDVNGHFICDEGRLSYKELEQNRQREFTCNSKVCSKDEALKSFAQTLKSAKNIAVLIDANLYNEEIDAILEFAQSLNAKCASLKESYYDREFEDEWLKSAWRAANIMKINQLNIAENFDDSKIDLLINFNHKEAKDIEAETKVLFSTHQEEADIVFGIASFSENSGTLTNRDNLIQRCEKAVSKNSPSPTIIELLSDIKEMM
jgi:NADH-quinone oxidoreductase subunit G